jgi:4-amino-4-deoxychorismate lyase
MYQLVETIKVLDGDVLNLSYHQQRLDYSFAEYYKISPFFQLSDVVIVPEEFSKGLVKLRFLYHKNDYKCEFFSYEPRKVETIKLIESNDINYPYKLTDRSQIDLLLKKGGSSDDILIVKNNYITDSSIANIVFHNNDGWFTPSTPLLKGTCRARLLHEGQIQEVSMQISDLDKFDSFCLINAMNCGELLPIPIGRIN